MNSSTHRNSAVYTQRLRRCLLTALCVCFFPVTLFGQPSSDESDQNESLPADMRLSGERDPLLDVEKPLITPKELDDFKRKQTDYVQALRAGETTGRSRELIREGLEVRLFAMTIPEQFPNINGLRRTFMRDIQNYAGAQQINPRQKRKFRSMVLSQTLEVLQELLQNNLQVRVAAASIAGDLNIVEEDRRARTPAEPFEPVLPFLTEIIKDSEQHQAVKIAAIQGIIRLLKSDEILKLPRNDKLLTAEAMAEELKKPETYFWYQQNLIRGMQASGIDVDRSGDPFIIQGLAQVLGDSRRDPRARAEAAYTLPRVEMPANVNLGLLSWQVTKATQELALEYNNSPEKVYWISTFMKMYGAFKPLKKDAEEGLIHLSTQAVFSAHQEQVQEAYAQSVAVVKSVWDNQGGVKLKPSTLVPITDWLKENDPGQTPLYPGGPTAAQISSGKQTASVDGL